MSDHPIFDPSQWITDLWLHYNEPDWIDRNALVIRQALSQSLSRKLLVLNAIDALLLIYPQLLDRPDLNNWMILLYDALLVAQKGRHNRLQVHIWRYIAASCAQLGRFKSADKAFEIALSRARNDVETVTRLQLQIEQLALPIQRADDMLSVEYTHELIVEVEASSSATLCAQLYDALLIAHGMRGETETAHYYGQLALSHWRRMNNKERIAFTAYNLMDTFQRADDHDQAHVYLEQARDMFAHTSESTQYVIMAYGQAVHNNGTGSPTAARQWCDIGLRELSQLQRPYPRSYYLAAFYHQTARACANSKQWQQAERFYRQALVLWRNAQVPEAQAEVFNALAEIEVRNNNLEEARLLVEHGLRMCSTLPQSPRTQQLRTQLDRTLYRTN